MIILRLIASPFLFTLILILALLFLIIGTLSWIFFGDAVSVKVSYPQWR